MKRMPTWAQFLVTLFILYLLFQIYDVFAQGVDNSSLSWAAVLLIIAAVGGLSWMYVSAKRRKYDSALKKELELSDTEGSAKGKVLYLRPFHTDRKRIDTVEFKGNQYRGAESVFCVAMSDEGIPYAIKNTVAAAAPLPGAATQITGGDDWQNKVMELMKESSIIMIYVDFANNENWRSSGTMWEVETALRNYKDKLILVPRLYNQNIGWIRYVVTTDIGVLFYPLYSIRVNRFWFPHSRRGQSYYQKWRTKFAGDLSETDASIIDDHVSAIIFDNGRTGFFKADNASIEAQLGAAVNAIRYKMTNKE